MVHVAALDIQASLRNPSAILEDSVTSVKTLYLIGQSWGITLNENQRRDISSVESQKGVIAAQRCSIENQKGAIAVQSQWQ